MPPCHNHHGNGCCGPSRKVGLRKPKSAIHSPLSQRDDDNDYNSNNDANYAGDNHIRKSNMDSHKPHATEPSASSVLSADQLASKQVLRRLQIATGLCVVFLLVEVIGGYLAGSLAVLSDAAHLLSDATAFAVAIVAHHLAHLPSTARYTYGLRRVESLAAFFSMASLAIVCILLAFEAIRRLGIMLLPDHLQKRDEYGMNGVSDVDGPLMSGIAATGVVVNLILAAVLGEHHVHLPGHAHDHGSCGGHDHGGHSHKGHDHGSHDHKGHEDGGHDHGGQNHGGHDHGGHGHDGNCHGDHDHGGHDHGHGHGHDSHPQQHHYHNESEIGEMVNDSAKMPSLSSHSNSTSSSIPEGKATSCCSMNHGHSMHSYQRQQILVDGTHSSSSKQKSHVPAALFESDRSMKSEHCHPCTPSISEDDDSFTSITHDNGVGESDEVDNYIQPLQYQSQRQQGITVEPQHWNEVVPNSIDKIDGIIPTHDPLPPKSSRNVNLHAAYVHVLGDLAQSVAVLIAGLLIWWHPSWVWIDPVCTLAFCVLVFYSTLGIIKQSVSVLLEQVPPNVSWQVVHDDLVEKVDGLTNLHDVHIWCISDGVPCISLHASVVVTDSRKNASSETNTNSSIARALINITRLCRMHGIRHVTAQLQPASYEQCLSCCAEANKTCHRLDAANSSINSTIERNDSNDGSASSDDGIMNRIV